MGREREERERGEREEREERERGEREQKGLKKVGRERGVGRDDDEAISCERGVRKFGRAISVSGPHNINYSWR